MSVNMFSGNAYSSHILPTKFGKLFSSKYSRISRSIIHINLIIIMLSICEFSKFHEKDSPDFHLPSMSRLLIKPISKSWYIVRVIKINFSHLYSSHFVKFSNTAITKSSTEIKVSTNIDLPNPAAVPRYSSLHFPVSLQPLLQPSMLPRKKFPQALLLFLRICRLP